MSYRLYQVFWEINDYERGGDVNGHSVTMRLEYWRIASMLIGTIPLIGSELVMCVKDLMITMIHAFYINPEFRLRAHDQYLKLV